MRLIDADALKELRHDIIQGRIKFDGNEYDMIDKCPTIDAVEVVRCKDCAWVTLSAESNRYWCSYYLGALEVKATNFCGLAKRKNDYGSDAERREP